MAKKTDPELEAVFDRIRETLEDNYFFGEVTIKILQSQVDVCIIAQSFKPHALQSGD